MKTITMKQFLINPTGSGSANVARRDRIRADLENRYAELYKKNKKLFKVKPYIDKTNNEFYYVFKIPSEEYYDENLTYDVVIKFIPPKNNIGEFDNLNGFYMNIFSNSPNFMFTYAYVFYHDGIIIDWLRDKIPPRALTEKPDVRNPDQVYGFEKSIYFALLYLDSHKELMNSKNINKLTFNRQVIKSSIRTCLQKLQENKNAKARKKEKEYNKLSNRVSRALEPVKKVISSNTKSKTYKKSSSVNKITASKKKTATVKKTPKKYTTIKPK